MTVIIFVVAAISACAITVGFLFSAQAGILLAFLTKPIIDATWAVSFGPVNILKIIGVVVPTFVCVHVLSSRSRRDIPLLGLWIVFVLYSSLSYCFDVVYSNAPVEELIIGVVERSFRTLNGLAGYLMVQAYFSDRENFRRLVIFIILAGVFPTAVGLYQVATGTVFQERYSVGLVRNVGFYHDAFSMRSFMFQTIIGIALFWVYFLRRNEFFKRIILFLFISSCTVVLFKVYSKAAVLIFFLWVVIWTGGQRTLVPAILVIGGLLIANALTSDMLVQDVERLYSKELVASDDNADDYARKRTFSGRWFGWISLMDQYIQSSFMQQVFGSGRGVSAHNDFLGRLIANGVVGVLLYASLLFFIGLRLARNYLRSKTTLNVVGIMIFAMWMVDTIGLVPSQYSGYQWFVWGVIGLAIKMGGDDFATERKLKLEKSLALSQ